MQGLIAAGRDPAKLRRGGARSPLAYLRSLVGSDGAVRYSRTSTQTPVWVTGQVLTALAGKAYPVAPAPRARSPRAEPAPSATPAAADGRETDRERERGDGNRPRRHTVDGPGVAEPELQIVPAEGAPIEVSLPAAMLAPAGAAALAMVVSPDVARRAGELAVIAARTWLPAG